MSERSDVMMPVPDSQLALLALTEAIRSNTAATERSTRHNEKTDGKLDVITKTLGEMNTRLTLLERDGLRDDVTQNRKAIEQHDHRISALEAEREQRRGALGLAEWFFKNWPALIGFLALLDRATELTQRPIAVIRLVDDDYGLSVRPKPQDRIL